MNLSPRRIHQHSKGQISKNDKLSSNGYHVSLSVFNLFFFQEILVCGHSLEVNITTNLDFFLSVAQVQLLHQLIVANMTGLEPSSKATEVTITWSWLGLLHLCQLYIHSRKTIIKCFLLIILYLIIFKYGHKSFWIGVLYSWNLFGLFSYNLSCTFVKLLWPSLRKASVKNMSLLSYCNF